MKSLNIQGGATDRPTPYVFKKRFNMKGLQILFNTGNTASIVDIQRNAIHCLAISDQTGATSPGCAVEIQARFQDA